MTSDDEHPPHNPAELRSFGRRRGRKASPHQQRLLDEGLPRVRLALDQPGALTAARVGEACTQLWLEIGFGGGEHLVWQAAQHPGVALIGCEPYLDGVVKVLNCIEAGRPEGRLTNIRIHPDDARAVLRWLDVASLERAFILFPDPWPKTRHRKRRLVTAELIGELARVLRPGAELRLATDIGDYASQMLAAVLGSGGFEWLAERASDWRLRPPDWPPTRYELKALREGRRCTYLRFVRRGQAGPEAETAI